MKKRYKKILLWSLSLFLLFSIATIISINYVVDYVLRSIYVMDDIPVAISIEEADKLEDPDIYEGVSGEQEEWTEDQLPEPVKEQDSLADGDTQPEQSDNDVNRSAEAEDKPDDFSYTPDVSADKARKIEEDVTLKEKAKVAKILLPKLNRKDIHVLQDMAEGGLSVNEKREVRSMMLKRLSPEEYNDLVQIAAKYGVSSGKTYDEAKQEEGRSTD